LQRSPGASTWIANQRSGVKMKIEAKPNNAVTMLLGPENTVTIETFDSSVIFRAQSIDARTVRIDCQIVKKIPPLIDQQRN
jgi:hypothetical protein